MIDPYGFRLSESMRDGVPCLTVHDAGDLSPNGFDAALTFESGQCFRWRSDPAPDRPDRYAGIVRGVEVAISSSGNRSDIVIENATPEDFHSFWHAYLDLGADYSLVARRVGRDGYARRAARFACGARMLKQDFEETLFSFILSAQNNVPRIMSLVQELSMRFGSPIAAPLSRKIPPIPAFAFPTSSALSEGLCSDENMDCGFGKNGRNACPRAFAGYRCPYVAQTARMLASGMFEPDPALLSGPSAKQARTHLKKLPGVGDKVADCVLLYSGFRTDVCPVDTWIARIVRDNYLGPGARIQDARSFMEETFAQDTGMVQFWFFIYARKGLA